MVCLRARRPNGRAKLILEGGLSDTRFYVKGFVSDQEDSMRGGCAATPRYYETPRTPMEILQISELERKSPSPNPGTPRAPDTL